VSNTLQKKVIEQIQRDPNTTQFIRIFYNKVEPEDVPKYHKPANITDQQWEEAKANSPDPTCMVPVFAIGFQDLFSRVTIQNQVSEDHARILESYKETLKNFRKKHDLEISAKIQEYKQNQAELSLRLLKIMVKFECFRTRGYPVQPSEEHWRNVLEHIQKELNSPNQYKAKLSELSSSLSMQEELRGRMITNNLEDESYKEIANILEVHSETLSTLLNEIKSDMELVQVMAEKYKEQLPGTFSQPPKYNN